jgi:hypothetical protein
MVDVPAEMPVVIPDIEPMLATAVLLLLQLPPALASDNAVAWPMHTPVAPVITDGSGLTVTIEVAVHPVDSA